MTTVHLLTIAMAALMAVGLFVFARFRTKDPDPKLMRALQLVGMVCAVASILALCASFYYSRDTTQLFKLALPFTILVLLLLMNR